MQSVLVTACSSNGPMLSHSTPRYRKTADIVRVNNSEVQHKEELLHNGEKVRLYLFTRAEKGRVFSCYG